MYATIRSHSVAAMLLVATTAASAADTSASPPSPQALHSVTIESETAAATPLARPPQLSETAKAALREQLRSRVTRSVNADGSKNYNYNGLVQETLVARVDADGTLRLICNDASHQHAQPAPGDSDVR